ncbi:MAG: hypothetical protein LCH98_02740 [Actinobacteria bacterium]|nr:hypothetical protein [Actinomycetota bacterium]
MGADEGTRRPELTMFAVQLGRAMEARGLSLERISAHLRARGHRISVATLSYWKTGRSIPGRTPSIRAVGALEEVLQVPRGSLARLIPRAVAGPAASATVRIVDLFEQQRLVDEMVRDLGRTWDEGVELVAMHAVSTVDERGLLVATTCREVLRVVREDTDSYLIGLGYPLGGCLPTIAAVSGCREGRWRYAAAESTAVRELMLPMLGVGATHVIDYDISYDVPSPAVVVPMAYVLGTTSPVREIYVEVRFTPGAEPAEVSTIEMTPEAESLQRSPGRDRMALHRRLFGPGKLGFEWESHPPEED